MKIPVFKIALKFAPQHIFFSIQFVQRASKINGTFKEGREDSIHDHKIISTTVKHPLYAAREREHYCHIYYNEKRNSEQKISYRNITELSNAVSNELEAQTTTAN